MTSGAFSVRDALDAGLGEERLRGRDLVITHRGARAPVGVPLPPCAAFAPLLRAGDRFSHTTAAELWGAPLPRELEALVHVTSSPRVGRVRRPGVVGHVSSDAAASLRGGVPVSEAVTMFVELAGLLALDALVAVGDHLVLDPRVLDPHDIRPHVTLPQLRQALEGRDDRGVRRARAAAALVREGVESPMETRLRLLVRAAGLPEPVCGYELLDARSRRIGWFDLAWPAWRVIAEYDGDQHRTDRAQYERDIRRFDRADDAGWKVVRVRSRGIHADHAATAARIRGALARAGWTPNGRVPSFGGR